MGGKVGENPAALRAAIFSLASKNLRGGGAFKRPSPSRARVNKKYITLFSSIGMNAVLNDLSTFAVADLGT